MEIGDDWTILDVIAEFDNQYYKAITNDQRDHKLDFPIEDCFSALQYVWNPLIQKFYEDVGVEARTSPPQSKMIPLHEDWRSIITDGSHIVISPDANC